MKKIILYTALTLVLSLNSGLCAEAVMCNSPCPDPCAPSRTICEGTNCTTYCAKSPMYNTVYYTTPGVSFSYSTPNVSFSISNEVYGIYNYYSRPNFTITNGFRPIYHYRPHHPVYKNPPKHNKRPHYVNKPQRKPASTPGKKPPKKP